ncbi:site-2 protease family protein [cyanobacterium endosymbiont of Epithemia turgida]|uniref:site-2 protease family protein n=1 Tax=cyanobacterium endosymbiont of Epithemia turgida TaxID=718217 RepID=UPI0004D14E31|nr:site-2 protease family protein [cyanobacterium endosymbiont of Epithemia turgida]BAP17329.1 peptidase M50 [cyanobacterium endosymbiont of Epithemia turgida isolate EtSB Lake Yunoko]
MWLLLLLLTLSIITYILIKRTVTSVTHTPAWLLWLVVMTPPIAWTVWYMVMDEEKSIPLVWIILPLFICFITYGWLISIGRILTKNQDSQNYSLFPNLEKKIKTLENPVFIRPITATEEQSLRNCFPWGVYYLQNLDYRPQAILCRGKLRIAPEKAYQSIKTNIERVFGDRFLILFQESLQGQPFFALVANPWAKSQQKEPEQPTTRPLFALGLLLLTLLTTTIIGTEIAGISVEQWQENLRLLLNGLPYSLGVIIILGIHELSHYLTAIRYKVITTLPYFIPIPFFLGTFGAFIQIKSPIPHRQALFDVGIAGPLGGFMVTVPILLWGLSLSKVVPLVEESNLLSLQAFDPRGSFLFAIFAKLVFGSSFIAEKAIHLHPLAIAGYVGLIITALNLMPVGQLDGGHIVHGMFGQRAAIIIGQFTRLFVLALGIIRQEFLLWAILLFFMPTSEQTALNDVTELDDRRDILGLFSLALLIMILLPLPGTLAQWLNL